MSYLKGPLFVLLSLLSVTSVVHSRAPGDIDYFIANGDYLDVTISPDGRHLAALVRGEESYALVFLDVRDFSVVGGMKTGRGELILDPQWASNKRVIFRIADFTPGWEQPRGTGELWAVDTDGGRLKLLAGYRANDSRSDSRIRHQENRLATFDVLSSLPGDAKYVLVVEYPWEKTGTWYRDTRNTYPVVHRMHIYSGKLRKVEALPHRGASVFADRDGELRYLTWADEEATLRSAYREQGGDEWKDAARFDAGRSPRVYAIDKATGRLYLKVRHGPGEQDGVVLLDPQTGERQVLVNDLQSNITHVLYDAVTTFPVGVISVPSQPRYDYFEDMHPLVRLHRGLRQHFSGQLVDITDSDASGKLHVIRVESDTNPGEFYLFDSERKEARFLFSNRSWMDVALLSPKEALTIRARDDLEVPALLTMPKSDGDAAVPLIVLSHGGPHGIRSPWQFEEEVQLLASRGYAVLEVNFRGSGGYGQRFMERGYGQWGGAMIDDIEDAVNAVRQRYPQLGKVCSYGASFGGFASLALATREPEWLACAVGFAGVYDLAEMYKRGDIPTLRTGEGYLNRALGTDEAELDTYSPAKNAGRIKVPVLLVHGGQDRRVPQYHSEVMRDALAKAGGDVELIIDPTVGHGMFGEDRRGEFWARLLAFFGEHLRSEPLASR